MRDLERSPGSELALHPAIGSSTITIARRQCHRQDQVPISSDFDRPDFQRKRPENSSNIPIKMSPVVPQADTAITSSDPHDMKNSISPSPRLEKSGGNSSFPTLTEPDQHGEINLPFVHRRHLLDRRRRRIGFSRAGSIPIVKNIIKVLRPLNKACMQDGHQRTSPSG